MKRIPLLAATAAIAIASTGVIATAQSNTPPAQPERPAGPAMMVFERYDTNGDGTVTREEVDALKTERFTGMDADSDGQVSAEELFAAQEARRVERQQERAARMVEQLDEDGNGLLSAEELADAGPRGDRPDLFERFDTDGDGSITQAELEDARGMFRGHGKDGRGNHGDRQGFMKRGHEGERGQGQGQMQGYMPMPMPMPGYGMMPGYGYAPMPGYGPMQGYGMMPGYGHGPQQGPWGQGER
ncbi:EF-hand domain-containing protein [Pseudoruegeria sp. HB172150]|uniref:EF-hand domain-containing protein n=1 Tax=Pseudoruegeria sp. HB172150 TaxID=2721164 RepID=UPI001554E73F|nr:EF-hand domain-containing protein [Pseudoruegeria sp. HB172150]